MNRQPLTVFRREAFLHLSRSTGFGFGLVIIFALFILWQYDPLDQPVIGDRAYFLYMAQAMVRGENLYQTTTLGYPPLGIMLSAGSMWIGQFTGWPSYLLPRMTSLFIAALSCGFLFLFTRRAFRSTWFGMFSVSSLLVLDLFAVFSVINLEPKLLAQFFAVLLMWVTQKKAWFWAGVCGSLAALCWQPAVIILLPPCLILCYKILKKRLDRRSFLIFFMGILSGGMPLIIYLLWTGQIHDFISQAVIFKLLPRPHFADSKTLRLVIPTLIAFRSGNLFILFLAVFGICVYGFRITKLRWSNRFAFLFRTQNGGIFLHTFVWFAYHIASSLSSIEGHDLSDFMPFVFLFSIWASVGFFALIKRWHNKIRSQYPCQQDWFLYTSLVALIALVVYQALVYEPDFTLEDELTFFASIYEDQKSKDILAVNFPELYVLKGQASPWRSMYIDPYFMDFINWKQPAGCQGLMNDIDQNAYPVIVIRQPSEETECLEAMVDNIGQKYDREVFNMEPIGCGSSQAIQQLTADAVGSFLQEDFLPLAHCIVIKQLDRTNYQRLSGQITIYNLTESN